MLMIKLNSNFNFESQYSVKNILIDSLLVLYLFIYIFSPPIVPNIRLILDVLNFIVVMICILYNGKINIPLEVKKTVLPFIPFLLYIWLNALYFIFIEKPVSLIAYDNSDFIRTAFMPIYIWLKLMALCFVLQLIKRKMKIKNENISNYILIAGFLQFLCAMLAFLFPGIRDIFLQIINNNTEGAVQKSIFEALDSDKRCYGFSSNLFDSIGYIVSLISAIAFIKTISRKSIKYFICFICTVFIVLLNTRTGLVLDVISIVLISLFYARGNVMKNFIGYSVIAITMLIIGCYVISILPESTLSWATEGLESVYNLLVEQEYSGIFLTFFLYHLNFPDDIIFGDGAIPDAMYYNVSDIGYVQCIWRYGIVGTILLMMGISYFFYSAYKKNRESMGMQCFILCSSVIFFVYLIKLFSLYNLGGYAVFIPIIIMSLLEKDECNDRIG